MTESSQMLRQKASELETVVTEAQRELARVDESRRSEAHKRLAEIVREARGWLESRDEGREVEGEAASAEARKAEGFLHEIRMRRTEL